MGHAWRPRRVSSAPVHLAGVALVAVSIGMFLSAVIEAGYRDPEVVPLVVSGGLVGGVGLVAWRGSVVPTVVRSRDAFKSVTAVWVAISIGGAVPYVLSGMLANWELALFESISGFTATGATVVSPIEGNGRGLLFFRQLTQWYGSMGMIVLAVAVLPFLGIGGMELLRAEAPGPQSDKLAPRVSETAKRLWLLYAGLTAASALALMVVGVGAYDAVSHALTAVATGGLSPYDASVGFFDSVAVEVVLMVTMFMGAVNFALIWSALQFRSPRVLYRSSEFRFYVRVLVGAVAFIALVLIRDGVSFGRAVRDSSFITVSLMTTTGFGTADFAQWPAAALLVLLALMVTGGMAGSTSGAVKLFRVQVALKHTVREVQRLRHPRAVFPIRLGQMPIEERIVASIFGFLIFYFVVGVLGVVGLVFLGTDFETEMGTIATAMGGVGPGFGETGPASNFLTLNAPQRLITDVYMILGRLEIVPVLLAVIAIAPRRLVPRELR